MILLNLQITITKRDITINIKINKRIKLFYTDVIIKRSKIFILIMF